MTGLDTNILVRYITRDDPLQTPKAKKLIEEHCTNEEPGFISLASILELVWALESGYGFTKLQTAQAVERFLQIETLFVQSEREVYVAMLAQKTGQGSFADALIGALGLGAGCTSTLTFDKKASRLQGFELI